jgi:hypothetical protein
LVPFPHEPPDWPPSSVAELPHTVIGALTDSEVPLPDSGPLLLPLSSEAVELEVCVPPLPIDTG